MKFRDILQGFLFGMLLQLAVGPICIYVLNIGVSMGFVPAFISVLGVTLADAVYIIIAVSGVAGAEKFKKAESLMKRGSGIVQILLGLYMAVSALAGRSGTDIQSAAGMTAMKLFTAAFLLTLANPITIVFWAGVFAGKVTGMDRGINAVMFGLGAVLSTLVFLSVVSALGTVMHLYLPALAVKILNVAAGIGIILFGVIQFNKTKL